MEAPDINLFQNRDCSLSNTNLYVVSNWRLKVGPYHMSNYGAFQSTQITTDPDRSIDLMA